MPEKPKKVFLMICGQAVTGQQKDWAKLLPELGIIAEIETVSVFDQNSSDLTPAIWSKLAKEINDRLDQAAGFVVLHGIDNLLYTSAAMSFMLQRLTKPVIFTGGFFSEVKNKKIDTHANLINAVQAARFDFLEVCLMFGNRLLRANQSQRVAEDTLNLFVAPEKAILGRIDFSIKVFDKVLVRHKGKTKLSEKLEANIEVIKLDPLINLKELSQRLSSRHGVVVQAGQYQALPEDIQFVLEKLTADVPVIIWSKVIEPSVISPKNFILVNNMTWEATLTKAMWALGQSVELAEVKKLLAEEVAGEFIN